MITNNILTILFYISSFLFLRTYVGFFEKHYQTRVSDSQNAFVMVLLLFLSVLFSFEKNIYMLLFVSLLLYAYLHVAFQFSSKRDIIVNLVFLITGLLILCITDSFIQCLFQIQYERSIFVSVLSISFASSVFYLIQKYEYKCLHLQVLYKLKHQDVWILFTLTIFFFFISFVLLYFSFLYDTLVFELFSFTVIGFLLLTLFSFLYVIEKLWKGYEAETSLKQMVYNEQLNYAYYKHREEVEQEVSLLLHDMKNHLQVATNMAKTNGYLEQVEKKIQEKDIKQYSTRHILQILFYDKVKYAKQKDVDLVIHPFETTFYSLTDFDLVTIFSNILDNAIEAVEDIKNVQRKIDLYIKEVHRMIVITVKNPMQSLKKDKQGKLLSTKKHHQGLGLVSVQHAIKTYHGDIQIKQEDGMFIVTIVIQMK